MLPLIPHLGHFQILHVEVVLCAPHVNLPKHFFVMNFSNKSFACCLLTLYNINILSITTIFFLTYAMTKNFLNFINDERMRISVNTFELVLFCKWIQNISTQYQIYMLTFCFEQNVKVDITWCKTMFMNYRNKIFSLKYYEKYWNFLITLYLPSIFSFSLNFLFDSTWTHGTTQPIDDTCWAVHTRPKFFESWFHETSKKEIDFFLPENLFLSLASITGYFIAVLSLFCLLNLIFVTAGGES